MTNHKNVHRGKSFEVSNHQLVELLRGVVAGGKIPCVVDLPRDAHVIGVQPTDFGRSWKVGILSEEFDEVPEGAHYPDGGPLITYSDSEEQSFELGLVQVTEGVQSSPEGTILLHKGSKKFRVVDLRTGEAVQNCVAHAWGQGRGFRDVFPVAGDVSEDAEVIVTNDELDASTDYLVLVVPCDAAFEAELVKSENGG